MNATITPIRHDRNWRQFAACAGTDPDLFTGPDEETETEQAARESRAVAVCDSCPVRAACLDFAIETRIEFGVYGGHAEDERPRGRRRKGDRDRKRHSLPGPGRGRTDEPRPRTRNGRFAADPAFCASGRHPRTEADTGARGNCLACRRDREGTQASQAA